MAGFLVQVETIRRLTGGKSDCDLGFYSSVTIELLLTSIWRLVFACRLCTIELEKKWQESSRGLVNHCVPGRFSYLTQHD